MKIRHFASPLTIENASGHVGQAVALSVEVTAASTSLYQKLGYVFLHCTLTADSAIGKVF
jgi:hypothetical protein